MRNIKLRGEKSVLLTLKKLKKPFLLLMCTLLLFLPACGTSGGGDEDGAGKTAMGRYVEEALPLPEEIVSLYHIGLDQNGDFRLVGETADETIRLWMSKDDGESWIDSEADWLSALNETKFDSISFDEEGHLWFTQWNDAYYEDYTSEDADISVFAADGEGIVEKLPYSVKGEDGNGPQDFVVNSGRLVLSYGEIAVVDALTGSRIMSAESENYLETGGFLLRGDTLAVADTESLKLYDVTGGQQTRELYFQKTGDQFEKADFFDFGGNKTIIAETWEENVYGYCNKSGIYRISEDGLIHERIVAGDMTSLIMPTVSIKNLFVKEGAYFAYAEDKDSMPWNLLNPTLLRYRYDKSVDAVPKEEISVYSLNDVPTVRQAIGIFQRENPNIRVRYETALSQIGEDGLQDALRTLSTELLAGKGPDILIMDDLPVESYIEKGVLIDLNEVLSDDIKEQQMPNLLTGSLTDGKLYAVPARFTVTMLLTDEETAVKIGDMKGLSSYVSSLASPQIGIMPNQLLETLYPVFKDQWFYEDGTLNEEVFRRQLEQIKRIYDLYDGKDFDALWNPEGDARAGAIGWLDGWTPFYLHRLTAVDQLAGPYTVLTEKEGGYVPYPSPSEGAVDLNVIAGINHASENKEMAGRFVECMLSETVQSLALGDGMPVNKLSIKANQESPYLNDYHQRFGVSFSDEFEGWTEKSLTLPVYWPDQEYFDNFFKMVETLQTRQTADSGIKQIILEETRSYLNNGRTLDDTVRNLKQKLDIYVLE